MSFNDVRKKLANIASDAPVSHACPAHGCPNAASVSFGGAFACFDHARAPSVDWPAVTQRIRDTWPDGCNWNHNDRVAADEARRRALAGIRRVA